MLLILTKRVSQFSELLKKETKPIVAHIWHDRIIYLMISMTCLIVTLYAKSYGYNAKLSLFAYVNTMQYVVVLTIVLAATVYYFVLIKNRERRPLLCYWNKIKQIYHCRAKIIAAFVLLTALSLFLSSFTTAKAMIPLVKPFQFDLLFYEIDEWLFVGQAPWKIVHSWFDKPFFTLFTNICYNMWFFLKWIILCYFLLAPQSKLRRRFLISWILCWSILGMVLATMLSSAGPAFVARVDIGNQHYDQLMLLLQQQHDWLNSHGYSGVWALNTQDLLWESYRSNKGMLGSGISAMPSLHVSMAMLMALSMHAVNRYLGYAFYVYGLFILVGSVSLAWHYFIDGLVSVVLTIMIWKLSKIITDKTWQPNEIVQSNVK
ncbi:phosphatase PAP2 family protein [Vibrio marinisediminis]|nr:phosphatase PAP2 family protein [Vibrio marinisediminis]